MNLLSSTNPPSLPSKTPPTAASTSNTTSASSPQQQQQSASPRQNQKSNPGSPMSLSMAFLPKSRPLDLSATDRVNSKTSTNEQPSPKIEDDLETKCQDGELKKETSGSSEQTEPKTEELSAQVKTLTEFFKTLTSTSAPLDATVASLQALIKQRSEKEDASSLEALHQLGWQLINLGRGNLPPPNPPNHQAPNSLWVPGSRQQPQQQTPQSQQPPLGVQHSPNPMSSIAMRGNQKYSAFYQHNRKHQSAASSANTASTTTEESEVFRQSTPSSVSQYHRVGFPSRRLNGPGLSNQTRCHFPNPSAVMDAPLKPSGMGPRMQGDLTSPPRSRETAFLCSCGEDFESLYVFTIHMRDTGHKPRSSQPERDIPKLVRGQDMWINSETEQTREILRCMRCNQSFRSLPELTMHMMKTSHYSEIVYSDAGRNLLASQTFSERNRGGNSTNASSWGGGVKGGGGGGSSSTASTSSTALKRPGRSATTHQNGQASTSEPVKPSMEIPANEKRVNGHPRFPTKPPRLEEPLKCERPASSHEMHVVKPSPKPAASPEALSCPSELQRSAASSPRNENEKHESKYLNSPTSSRENTSPRVSGEDEGRNCTDSVIRQIESFVEKSLPFSSGSSPVTPRPQSWQQRQQNLSKMPTTSTTAAGGGGGATNFGRCNLSPMAETDTSRSTPDKCVSRKRRFSSGSSNSAAPSGSNTAEATVEKRPLIGGFSAEGGLENPLSSLQKLVETTHQSSGGLKSPMRPFGQANEISPVPSNHSNDMEVSGTSKSGPSTSEAIPQPPNIAAAISALQSIMSKMSNTSGNTSNTQQPPGMPNIDLLMPTNGEGGSPNLVGLLSAFLNSAKQPDGESKAPDTNLSLPNLPTPSKMFEHQTSVFPGSGFDFATVAKSQALSVHMNPAVMAVSGPSMVANITKKAKCHFCGKPFANKGQVRLHISKNKCPCLLQQSALGKPSGSSGNKSGLPFPYPGFPHGAPDLSKFFSPPPPPPPQNHHQPQQQAQSNQSTNPPSTSTPKTVEGKSPAETAALAAFLRHLNTQQNPPRPNAPAAALKPADFLASLNRPAEANPPGAINALFSILFPSTGGGLPAAPPPPPPPPPAPPSQTAIDTSGLTPEQKALFLFAQAVVSLAVANPSALTNNKPGDEMTSNNPPPPSVPPPPPHLTTPFPPPLNNLLQGLNLPKALPQESIDNPEGLMSYLNAIRRLVSMENASSGSGMAATSSPTVVTAGSATSSNAATTLTTNMNSATKASESVAVTTSSKDSE